jgi:hypothetical protein
VTDYIGPLTFTGTAGTTPTAAELGVTSVSGAGTAIRRAPGLVDGTLVHLQTEGQWRGQKDVLLATSSPVRVRFLHRGGWLVSDGEGGYEIDPTQQLPTAVQNVVELRDASTNVLGAVAFKSTGKLNLLAKTGGTNKDSTQTFLDGEPFWIDWNYDPATLTSEVKVFAGSGHSELPEWTYVDTVTLTGGASDIATTAIHDIRFIEIGPSTASWRQTFGYFYATSDVLTEPTPPTGPPALPITYDFEGHQVGQTVTSDREGYSYQHGPGHGLYSDDTALPDSLGCLRVKGRRTYGTLVDPSQSIHSMRGFFESATSPTDSVPFSRFVASDGTVLAGAHILDSGKIALKIGDGGGQLAKSDQQYFPGGYWFTHTYDKDNAAQELVIWSIGGLVQERLIGSASVDLDLYAYEFGSLGGDAGSAFELFIDDLTIDQAELIVGAGEFVDDGGMLWQAHGAITDRSCTIKVIVPGAIQIQLIVEGDGAATVPDLVNLDEDFAGTAVITDLDGQVYEATVRARADADSPWITVGQQIKWIMGLRAGEVGEHTIWSVGCIKDKGILTDSGFTLLGQRIALLQNAMRVDLSGDVDYSNKDDADYTVHLDARTRAVNRRQAYRDMLFGVATSRKSSDHDGGVAGNNIFHGDGILASKAADVKLYPNYGQSLGNPTTDWEYTIQGASLDFYADTRSNNRSDPAAVDDDTKTCIGIPSRDKFIDLCTNPPVGVWSICFHTDMGFIGDDPGHTNSKTDAWWSYPNEKAMIIAAGLYFQNTIGGIFEVDQGDNHETIWLLPEDNPDGYFLIAGGAGMDRSSGNVAKFVDLMPLATNHHPPLEYLPDTGEVISYPIANFIEHTRIYTGTELTVITRAWDGLLGTMTFDVERQITGLPPPDTEIGGLLEFQFAIDDFIFGMNAPLDVSHFERGSPSILVQESQNPVGSGLMFGRDRIAPATWSWDLFAGPQSESIADAREAWAPLMDIWYDEDFLSTPNVVKELRYRVGAVVRSVFGRPRGANNRPEAKLGLGALEGHADFKLADHRLYSYIEDFLVLDMISGSIGGLTFPLVFPLTTTIAHVPHHDVIIVGGTAPTPAVVTFWGPCDGAYMEVGDWRVGLAGTLGPEDVVVVDSRPWARSAILNGNASAAGLLEQSTRLDKMMLPPGRYEVRYGGFDNTLSARAKIAWRNAWRDF